MTRKTKKNHGSKIRKMKKNPKNSKIEENQQKIKKFITRKTENHNIEKKPKNKETKTPRTM